MTQTIRIPKPKPPLPPLPRTARKWVPLAMWAEKADERAARPSVGEADWKFVRTIRGLLGVAKQ